MKLFKSSQSLVARLLAVGLIATPFAAHAARELMADLPGSTYSNNGQAWGNYQTSTTFSNTIGGIAVGTSETILNTGEITIAPGFYFRPMLLPGGQFFTLNASDPFSAIGINIGQVDARIFDPTLVNDHILPYTDPYNAARYNYNDVCLNNACFTFQVIDIHLAPNVDVLEFNYAGNVFPTGATASFSAGPYGLSSFSPTFANEPAFCLKNGVQTTFTSIATCAAGALSVPEPDAPALFALGALGLAAGLRRRASTRLRSTS